MKKKLLYVFLFLPQLLVAQHVVNLTVTQPPEFGFSVLKQDTTILRGNSVILGANLMIFGGSGAYNYRWSPGASLSDSLILNPVASPVDTTLYKLTATDKNGCSFSVHYKVNVKTPSVRSDLIRNKADLDAVIFPNPGEGNFRIKLSGNPAKNIGLEITDVNGRLVKRMNIQNFTGNQTEMLTLRLAGGVYHLKITSGSTSINRSFIIH